MLLSKEFAIPALLRNRLLLTDCNPDIPGVNAGANQLGRGLILKVCQGDISKKNFRELAAEFVNHQLIELTEFQNLDSKMSASATKASGTVSGINVSSK